MTDRDREVVVITGASAGVGRATVRAFAARGAKIGLIARGTDGLQAAKREVEEMGGEALVLPLDTSDADAVENAAEQVEQTFGPIDYWVNNAIVTMLSPISHTPAEEFRRVAEINYLGYVHGTLAALKRMQPRDRGVIIQIGSALAYRGIPLQGAYCAAKHAVQGLCDSLHAELDHDGSRVRVTMVQLPAVNTPQFAWMQNRMPNKPQPLPPIYQPEVIARAIVWATQHKRREIYVGASTVKSILGDKIMPGYADRYLGKIGYQSQQRHEPDDPERPNNLWEPVAGDFGAHGAFDEQARTVSPQLQMDMHRPALGVLAAGLLGLWLGVR